MRCLIPSDWKMQLSWLIITPFGSPFVSPHYHTYGRAARVD